MKTKKQNNLRVIAVCIALLGFASPAVAQLIPADLFPNCSQWKVTLPDASEVKPLCEYDNNPPAFYVNDVDGDGIRDEEDGIVFRVEINENNGTTVNSKNVRSELRERLPDGSLDVYWTTTGTHVIYVDQAITHLPTHKDHIVATQIHGNKDAGIDDAMVLRLEGGKLFLSFNGGKLKDKNGDVVDDLYIKTTDGGQTGYVLGTRHEVIFEVIDGKHYCYYSEDGGLKELYNNGAGRAAAAAYLVKGADGSDYVLDLDYDQSYFKVGNYTQSNVEAEMEYAERDGEIYDPNALNYGEVIVYDFSVRHNDIIDGGNEGGVDPPAEWEIVPKENQITIIDAVGVGTEAKESVSVHYAYDGVVDTDFYWTGNADLGEVSITFDLGCNRDLDEIGIYFLKADSRTTNFDVAVSNDNGQTFDLILDGQDSYASGYTVDDEQLFDLTGANGQFVKIIGHGNSGGSGWSSIAEVSIYGDVTECEPLGANDFESLAGKGVRLFPVPTNNGVLNIKSADASINGVAIYNIYGQKVLSTNANNSKNLAVNVSALSKGTYFVILEGIGSSKFVVN